MSIPEVHPLIYLITYGDLLTLITPKMANRAYFMLILPETGTSRPAS
ncbi:MAG: hypothetical protein Q7U51_02800 [Methanoregula sp.]|nr:hypothetical protein [Methanoregula sp.]